MKASEWLWPLLAVASVSSADDGFTPKHERNRCAMRGQTKDNGFFGPPYPYVDNGEARKPDNATQKKLVDLCGQEWYNSKVCCDGDQLDTMKNNFGTVEGMTSSCPACIRNFVNLFCTFTCSPNQSLFVNITKADKKDKNYTVSELDNVWYDSYGSDFYDSCKDVKFGPTNSRAMSFIGGGAKNFQAFYDFLGTKRPGLGSPFQLNFPNPRDHEFKGMEPMRQEAVACNTTEETLRCTCVDCGTACAQLAPVEELETCTVGVLPCLSFAIILIYSIFIFFLVSAIAGHVAYRRHTRSRNERLRLLQDTTLNDEEDDDTDIPYRPTQWLRARKYYYLNTLCDKMFSEIGRSSATYPAITISTCLVVVGLLCLGWIRFAVETNPVRLWVSPTSNAAQEKQFFDNSFGPFYRAEQIFIVNDTDPTGPGPILSYDNLRWWFDVENEISRMKSMREGVTLDKVCFNPTGTGCVIQSVTGYFQGDSSKLNERTWASKIRSCAGTPTDIDCLPTFQQPLQPKMLFGGSESNVLDSNALIVTFVVNNYLPEAPELVKTMDWEATLKSRLLNLQLEAKDRGLRVSFNTEISLEEELNKSTNTDAKIVVISYIVMFFYASLALCSTTMSARTIMRSPSVALVQSKFMLGVVGILIVLLSVVASVGLFSAAGVKVTLIIAEVIPFLVLAVGVDNIFLLSHEFERVNTNFPDESIEDRIARTVGRMGPSILLSASMETVAFALGAVVGMPAVRNFAAYAAGAVFFNAVLQVTMFISVLALNQRRVEAGRADCFPCVTVRHTIDDPVDEDGLQRFIRRTYAPALLGNRTKTAVMTIFFGLFTAGLALVPYIKLGLDQRIALPSDSYLIPYFNDLYDYFDAGPPVYFVTRDVNSTQRTEQKELCGRFPTCKQYSLANLLEQEQKRSSTSYIADATASWIDDFFLWLDPVSNPQCCVDERTGRPCFADREMPWNRTLYGMPEGTEFVQYLERWLNATSNKDCVLGGKAAYSKALVVSEERLTTPATHFRTSHTPLHSQDDFINAYASARRIAEEISRNNEGIDVFPYSSFYIFFDQYSSIVRLSLALLGSALAVCFVVSSLLLGSPRTGMVVAVTVLMILVDVCGAMAVAGVSLNALTLVNLIICVGIGLEFCAHIARAFMFPDAQVMSLEPQTIPGFNGLAATNAYAPSTYSVSANRDTRAQGALVSVGHSVFTGITITKFIGVAVLAFTRSRIFEIYYFRIWLALVIFAALHALVFLPVALSMFGGLDGWASDNAGTHGNKNAGLQEDLLSRRRWTAGQDYDDDGTDDEDDGDDDRLAQARRGVGRRPFPR